MFDSSAGATGLDLREAKDMLEFCVDLDSQDDLLRDVNERHIKEADSRYRPRPSAQWVKIDDSRERAHPGERNPKRNGFGPFDNAWTLWRNTTTGPGGRKTYAVAIRGTVMSSLPSVWEDAIVATLAARNGMELATGEFLAITFADMLHAEVHAGFAYGVFGSLFNKDYGILPALAAKVEPGAELIITGHSQGAAMATLTHAFFHYAMQEKKFGLNERSYALKSYAFAQPKPGNSQFSMNFAEFATNRNNAFVFNNTLDPVTQVPMTLEFLADADADMPRLRNGLSLFVRGANNVFNGIRHAIDRVFAGRLDRLQQMGDVYMAGELKQGATRQKPFAESQNYVAAGTIIPLRGENDVTRYAYPPEDAKTDNFVQHHATTYRWLLERDYP